MSKMLLWVLAAHEGIPLLVATRRIPLRESLSGGERYLARRIDEDTFLEITYRQARRYRRQAGGRGISDIPFTSIDNLTEEVRNLRKERARNL